MLNFLYIIKDGKAICGSSVAGILTPTLLEQKNTDFFLLLELLFSNLSQLLNVCSLNSHFTNMNHKNAICKVVN